MFVYLFIYIYNKKSNISNFLENLGPMLDHHMVKYDNVLLVGDFNSETHEMRMNEFCDVYSLRNLITEPTCYKNPLNPSSIDLMLTNKIRSFLNSQAIETGYYSFEVFISKTSPHLNYI